MLIPVLLFIVGLFVPDRGRRLGLLTARPHWLAASTCRNCSSARRWSPSARRCRRSWSPTMSALSGHGRDRLRKRHRLGHLQRGTDRGHHDCGAPGQGRPQNAENPVAFFFAAAAIYCIAAYVFGRFTRVMGIIMLATFVAYMAVNVLQMKNTPPPVSKRRRGGRNAPRQDADPACAGRGADRRRRKPARGQRHPDRAGPRRARSVIALTFVARHLAARSWSRPSPRWSRATATCR